MTQTKRLSLNLILPHFLATMLCLVICSWQVWVIQTILWAELACCQPKYPSQWLKRIVSVYRLNQDRLVHSFTAHFLCSSAARAGVQDQTRGATRERMNLTGLSQMVVPVSQWRACPGACADGRSRARGGFPRNSQLLGGGAADRLLWRGDGVWLGAISGDGGGSHQNAVGNHRGAP